MGAARGAVIVACGGADPLERAVSGPPFLFNAVVVAVVAAGLWSYLRIGSEPVGETVAAVVAVVKSLPQRGRRGWVTMGALVLGPLNYGLFALVAGMVGVVVAALIVSNMAIQSRGATR